MQHKPPFVAKPLLTKPCGCGGRNPSCYKCGGWGYVDAIGEGRGTEKISVDLGTPGFAAFGTSGRKLTRHLRLVHPDAQAEQKWAGHDDACSHQTLI